MDFLVREELLAGIVRLQLAINARNIRRQANDASGERHKLMTVCTSLTVQSLL